MTVEGEKPHPPGGIYYVDVVVRQASLLEELVPAVRPDGADAGAGGGARAPGVELQRAPRAERFARWTARERIAAAVALRELGYDVRAEPEGALVVAVAPDAPAAGKLQPTEVIVAVDGKPVRTPDDLRRLIAKHKPGEHVKLRVRAGGSDAHDRGRHDREPRGAGPADHRHPGRAVRGHRAARSRWRSISAASAAPPRGSRSRSTSSEELRGNVDRGLRVAATGELELDGRVSPVGGVKQKILGARRSGADVFLVPAGDNAAEARRYAGDLRVIAVESFRQALRALATVPKKA